MSDLNLNTYGKLNSRLGLLPRVLLKKKKIVTIMYTILGMLYKIIQL